MRSPRGFTLLEVMIAIAILGLGLTAILSAQTGLFYSSERSANMSIAPGLARCRMSEIEVELMEMGYPLIDEQDDGPCCEEETYPGYECTWAIERVELPQAQDADLFGAATGAGGSGGGEMPASPGLGALSAFDDIKKSDGNILGDNPSLSNVNELMEEAGGIGGLEQLIMGMVYPQLKPMLEASIRKITVNVLWKEGSNERQLTVTQYVTSPQQGGFDPAAADGLEAVTDQLMNSGSPGSTPAAAAAEGK